MLPDLASPAVSMRPYLTSPLLSLKPSPTCLSDAFSRISAIHVVQPSLPLVEPLVQPSRPRGAPSPAQPNRPREEPLVQSSRPREEPLVQPQGGPAVRCSPHPGFEQKQTCPQNLLGSVPVNLASAHGLTLTSSFCSKIDSALFDDDRNSLLPNKRGEKREWSNAKKKEKPRPKTFYKLQRAISGTSEIRHRASKTRPRRKEEKYDKRLQYYIGGGIAINENTDNPIPIPPPAPSTSKAKQSPLDFFVEGGKPISKGKADKLDKQLIRLIVKEYNPFSIVEDKEFINFVKLLCPTYKLPYRKTISNGLLNATYNDAVDECRKVLDKVRNVSLTTDGWTFINNESFIATTVHFIDEDGDLKSLLLGCSRFEASHTSVNLGEDLKSNLQLKGLEGKVVCVTTDTRSHSDGSAKWVVLPTVLT
ncbi:hypothetical protein JTE90_025548 [Oedothorax gibbosus]|uniref:DUF659 domain-containing protein n=1 Tax=Oedothorax gibbosus TaxID=931172 RepID=A0AAV6TXU4_9ARAC|nr:hypothetical protein JTE90_025548 [Oedothorax gibbosus]